MDNTATRTISNQKQNEKMPASDKLYTILCTLFSALLITCTLTYKKIVYLPALPFHTFTLSVAVLITPLMFILTDLLAEFYDRQRASFCVRAAIGVNIVVALIVSGMDSLEATQWSTVDVSTFHHVFGSYGLAFVIVLFATYTAQLVDITLYLWLKKLTTGKALWLRNNGSTAISLLVDSVVAISLLTMLGIYPRDQMWNVIMNAYSYKLFITVCNIPFFYLMVGMIRKFILPQESLQTDAGLRLDVT
jgi:uncharacterized integral membrane protein (TIGR00697 family)